MSDRSRRWFRVSAPAGRRNGGVSIEYRRPGRTARPRRPVSPRIAIAIREDVAPKTNERKVLLEEATSSTPLQNTYGIITPWSLHLNDIGRRARIDPSTHVDDSARRSPVFSVDG
jgi:hypothetical protein